MGPDREEKGFFPVADVLQPAHSLAGDQGSGKPIQFSHTRSIQDEVSRVFVTRCRVVLGSHPVVVAVVVWLGVPVTVEVAVQVPFSHVTGIVAIVPENFGQGNFALTQVA